MRIHWFKCLPAIISILLTGCSATKLVGFADPDYRAAAFKSVAVYANTTDLMWRQSLENATVEAFAAVGVPAVATVNFLPPTREYSPEDRRRILKEQGTTALVVIEVGGAGVEETYIPVYGSTTKDDHFDRDRTELFRKISDNVSGRIFSFEAMGQNGN